MGIAGEKTVEYLVVDTTAFIQNAPLQDIAEKIVTCPEVVAEITNKRQLRRLVVLPYDLEVKEAFPENVHIITEFAKKTGDYPSLSATDIKVMALTYQLEKEKVGTEHLRNEPVLKKAIVTTKKMATNMNPDVTGFYKPGRTKKIEDGQDTTKDTEECREDEKNDTSLHTENQPDDEQLNETSSESEQSDGEFEEINENQDEETTYSNEDDKEAEDQLIEKLKQLKTETPEDPENNVGDDLLVAVKENEAEENDDVGVENDDDDDSGWITPSNIHIAKKQFNSEVMESKKVKVACMTTDFAMQNVLKQMNLNVSALDGRLIKQLRTFILRCYACFKTTSIMTKKFCPKCGNNTLKKVAVSLDKNGKLKIHINPRHPLTARGKKYSLPRIKGGKHPNNPILVEDQPMPDNKPTRLARTKTNPLDDDYIAGFSPFVMRDVNSKSAQLCIRPGQEFKYWMKKNPNESRRKRK